MEEPHLTGEQIRQGTLERLKKYNERGFLERYALFMGMAQVFELCLKQLLARKYKVPLEDTKRWTLGRVATELKERGLRSDFGALLKSVVEHRNRVAHELLADRIVLNAFLEPGQEFSEGGELFRAAYELEQLCFLYDWCEEHDDWGQSP